MNEMNADRIMENGDEGKQPSSQNARQTMSVYEKSDANFERLSTYRQLRSAIREKVVLEGNVTSLEIWRSPSGDKEAVLVVFLNEWSKIHIPFMDCYYEIPVESEEERNGDLSDSRKLLILGGLIGARIQFCLRDVFWDKESGLYLGIGSRTMAMRQNAARYFNPRSPRYKAGDQVSTKILVVGLHAVIVDFRGIEVKISRHDLTFRFMTDCNEFYRQGDTLNVIVKSITYRTKDEFPVISLSGCQYELQEAKKKAHLIRNGSRCSCVVAQVHQDRKNPFIISFYGWLQDLGIPIHISHFDINKVGFSLEVGNVVVVEIINHRADGSLNARVVRRPSRINTNKMQ